MNLDCNAVKNIELVLRDSLNVKYVGNILIKNSIIESISLEVRPIGKLTIMQLNADDSSTLFDFYFNGLSEESRVLFPPYPLFSPRPNSAEELTKRIYGWQEEDDWVFLNMIKKGLIIGVCLLKRFKTNRPVSGLAIREGMRRKGLGLLLQIIINEQARLLRLKQLFVTIAQSNTPSISVHEKAGFTKTGKLVPHFSYKNKNKIVDRHDVEMKIEFDYSN